MVAEYLKYRANIEYDAFWLLVVLNLKGIHQPINHGSMTTVIRY